MLLRVGLCVVLLGVSGVLCIGRDGLYPYGPEQEDSRLDPGDDESSDEVRLRVPIAFYDTTYRSVYVNTNGILSFDTDFHGYRSDFVIPIGYKLIAPFLADVDTSISGNVYYRETRDPSLLDMAARELYPNFPRYRNFRPRTLFIVTWDSVGFYQNRYEPVNTFQVVIASDGVDSFVMFLYPEVNWVRGDGKGGAGNDDVPAQAGFDAGDRRRFHVLPGSGNDYVRELADRSNAGAPGVWMFRIGNLNGGDIEESDVHGGGSEVPPASCSEGGAQTCSVNGQCRDYNGGFCCECQADFVGNGVNCVEPEIQMRVNGKVSGVINGVRIDDADLHAFLMFKDGRVYIAISRVDPELGYTLQGLYAFAGGLGWLLALPGNGRNGYMITGGDVTRTATVTFVDSDQTVTIEQTFVGQNADGHMEMHSVINGNMPTLATGASLEIADYTEQYRRAAPGEITSRSSQMYSVDGASIHFTVDQTLRYTECEFASESSPVDQTVSVSRSFIYYENNEQQIVRYAQSNKLAGDSGDPCADNGYPCDGNAECVPYGTSFQCQCKSGYRLDRSQRCVDVDECVEVPEACDRNADCYNSDGSYQCRCRQGYSGDGRSCQRESCGGSICDENAQCVYDQNSARPICQCNSGYDGDGVRCRLVIEFGCNEVNRCGDNAECVYDERLGRYECVCTDGFSGDGISCTDTGEADMGCHNCDPNAACVYDVTRLAYLCQCQAGFSGDGRTCFPIEDVVDRCGNCDVNAQCVFDDYQQRHACVCNPGYTGDGYRCQRSRDCSVYNTCDRNARCLPGQYGQYQCVCNSGFEGNGEQCREASCNVINNCDINADCLYDPHTTAYQCSCRQGYEGDGFSCRVTADCRRDPATCDPNARCENRGYDYICVCNPGYRGDGYRCAPVGDRESYLMITQGMSILRMPFEPTDANPGRTVLSIPGQTAIGIDVDCFARYFYWTDVSGHTINKAQLDGTDSQVLFSGLGSPEGIAIDWVTGNMYWTDSDLDRIEAAKTDGTARKTIVSEDLYDPRGIVVDPISGTMFWTDWKRSAPRIERANLDGGERRVLVDTDLGLPNGLTIDFETHHICWVDAGTKKIECVNYEGAGRRTIYTQTDYPFDVTYTHHVFYWTDWHKKYLPSINQFSSTANDEIALPAGGHGRLYGISVVKSQCPAGTNACGLNNGGCRFVCYPTPNGGRTCACPDDISEDECNRVGLFI